MLRSHSIHIALAGILLRLFVWVCESGCTGVDNTISRNAVIFKICTLADIYKDFVIMIYFALPYIARLG